MRMYNPAWEAIRGFAHTASMVDAQFDLEGSEIPADHGYALYQELLRLAPWLAETPQVAVHPVHAGPTGRNANLVINRRVKLVLRVPAERFQALQPLEGQVIDPGAGPLRIGALKRRPMTPFQTLYSHFVAMGVADEVEFLARAQAELDAMGIRCGLICGKRREMATPDGAVVGFSLMLHDVSLEESIRLQETGLGRHRSYGCGVFIPHKSIKEVAAD